jgi:plasmid stabilization system protein ParE
VKPTTFHPDADAEVTEAAEYYESRSLGLGSELLGEVEKALGQISTNPEACQRIGRRARRKSLWRFPYNLVYAVYPDRIRIVAFAHQKRRPYYWRKRLKDTEEQEGPTSRSTGPR